MIENREPMTPEVFRVTQKWAEVMQSMTPRGNKILEEQRRLDAKYKKDHPLS